jgi:type I restriction enzyme S subunit
LSSRVASWKGYLALAKPPHRIPATWTWQPLGNLVAILDSRRRPIKQDERLARIKDKPAEELYPYYGATQQAGLIDDYLFDEELVLLGEDGAPFLGGGKHVAYLVKGRFWVNNHAHALRGIGATNRFLNYALNRVDYTDYVTGTTRLKLTQGKLIHIPIPLPPLGEQERIVEQLDELIGLFDRVTSSQERRDLLSVEFRRSAFSALTVPEDDVDLHYAWDRVNDNWAILTSHQSSIDDLRETIRELAVEGRLVPSDPGDISASALLKSSIERKQARLQSGASRVRSDLPAITADEAPYPIPEGWALARLDEWCDVAGGIAKGRNLSGRNTVSLPYLRVANVKAGYLVLDEVKTIDIPTDEVDRYSLAAGDVLLTEGGDWDKLGRSAIWTGEIEPCLHQNHIFRARPFAEDLLPEWVALYTNSAAGRRYFQSKAKRTTNLASINMTELRSTPLPVPPPAEQRRILDRLAEIETLLTGLASALTNLRAAGSRFVDAITGPDWF